MLYERWLGTVAAHADETALTELATKRHWTFAELSHAVELSPAGDPRSVTFPFARGSEFILELLRAWRDGSVTCPLEPGVVPPSIPKPPLGIVHLKLTSGSSGPIKCVAFTAEQLVADVEAITHVMELRPDRPNLGVISMAHSYGFSNLILPLLLHGVPLILAANPLPRAVGEALEFAGSKILTIPAVPAMWRAWYEVGHLPPNSTLAISAGAPLPETLESAVYAANGLKIHNFVGASECGGILFDASPTPRTLEGYAGIPLPGVELARGVDGCLEIRGPAVGKFYWPNADTSLGDGRYRSRDLIEFDPSGGVFLRGRADDLINIAGRKIAPDVIEYVLRGHRAVRECLVMGLPASGCRGESIAVVVELADPENEFDLRDFARATLPEWQMPKIWHFVPRLEPGTRGKFSRAEWRERLTKQNRAMPDRGR